MEGERRESSRWTMRACAAATLSSWHASTTTRLVRSFLLCSNTTGRCESKPEEGGEVGGHVRECHRKRIVDSTHTWASVV